MYSLCVCAGEGRKLDEEEKRREGDGGASGRRMGCVQPETWKPGWVGVKWQILVGKLALPSMRELRDESCLNVPFPRHRSTSSTSPKTSRFSATHVEETSHPCSPPRFLSPTQFRLGEVPLPSTRWLKFQTDPLCVRESEQARMNEKKKERRRENRSSDARGVAASNW